MKPIVIFLNRVYYAFDHDARCKFQKEKGVNMNKFPLGQVLPVWVFIFSFLYLFQRDIKNAGSRFKTVIRV